MIAQNLAKFDTLDFDVFSNQKWDRLKDSHADDITVSWPDGHDTHGLARHIEDLKGVRGYYSRPGIALIQSDEQQLVVS